MTGINEEWAERQRRRWMRPNAHLYIRPDAYRFMAPGAPRLLGKDVVGYFWPGAEVTRPTGSNECKYAVDQPRVPRGNPDGGQWVRVAGPGGGRGSRYGGYFPGATYGQLVRLDQTIARTQEALARVRQYDPNWEPRTTSAVSNPPTIEGAIRQSEARAIEAEARYEQLRSRIGGNFGPSLEPLPRLGAEFSPRAFSGSDWISAYRAANNMPDLFGHPMWPYDKGTVAVTQMDGKLIFGVNSDAPGYSEREWNAARRIRDILIENNPALGRGNSGWRPNDAVFHAEATILFRAAAENGGTLAGRRLDVQTDRDLCDSCEKTLPRLSPNLGNPAVTFTNYRNGKTWLLENGEVTQIK